ncbi:MAG: transcription termination/antitermination protein NusA [Dehalococcoidia bacterium]|nr:transcription termination/antitermination protein NusA [Dehalococcoidia bacterium]
MKSDFLVALTQLAAERNLPREIVLSAIEAALASAYRKDAIAAGQNISVKLDPGSGDVTVNILKTVAAEVVDPVTEITLEEARQIKADAQVDDVISTQQIPHSAGRIAAQTAKQVVVQRLREAERDLVFQEFTDRVGEVFSVTVQRIEPRHVVVDMVRGEAILPQSEQMPNERYRQGQKFKVLLRSVERTARGTELVVSRADRDFLRRLFEMEVPEIYNGAVEMVAVSREAGSRSKVAVRARQDGVDPVGSCVGLRGVRIQNIVNELQGEKIDVLEWNRDISRFIANALNPAQVLRVELDSESQAAIAVVPDRQLSLAIGKEGQNARLAAKLTAWSVDIKSSTEAEALALERARIAAEEAAAEAARQAEEALTAVAEAPEEAPPVEPELAVATAEDAVVAEAAAAVQEVAEAIVEAVPEEAPVEEVVDEEAEAAAQAEREREEAAILAELEREEAEFLAALEAEEQEREAQAAKEAEATSLRDLPEHVWAIPTAAGQAEPSQIRFAEDIAGLRGGVTARRTRRAGNADGSTDSPPPARGRSRRRGRPVRRRR